MTAGLVLLVAIVAAVVLTGGSGPKRSAARQAQLGNEEVSAPTTSPPTTSATTSSPTTVVSGTPGQALQVSAAVVAENALPGTSAWQLADPANNHEIEGYANDVSVDLGQPVTLYVSTVSPSFHVEVYRMGYYQGLGGRLVYTSPDLPGIHQPAAQFTPGINMVECHWAPSVTLSTTTWPEGDYLLKLVASSGLQSWVPLTVRDDASTSAFLLVNAVTTWQAYNLYGGYDLYLGKAGKGTNYPNRSRVVSFDRPYLLGHGAGDFIGLEFPLVSLAESLGLDITYLTDVDLEAEPDVLLQHKAVFSMGHDEYYSLVMRNALQSARDHGVNLAFLGANAIYRHIRFESSPLGPNRQEVCYKSAQEDPLFGKDNADVTVDWRDPPTNDPESQIIGDYYQCNPVLAAMVIVDPDNWLFAGTGATVGQKLPNVVGTEYDRYDPGVPGPDDVEILAHSPLRCRGVPDYSDATYYTAPSGAGVFASGTINFVANIDPNCQPAGCNGEILGKVMENLFRVFGTGPAGLTHPSDPSESTVHEGAPSASSGATPPTTTAGGGEQA